MINVKELEEMGKMAGFTHVGLLKSDSIQLMPEVRDHEPRLALDGMSDGLYYYRSIVSQCRDYLKEDGALLFEIGAGQGAAVSELLKEAGFVSVQVIKDLAGLDRVVAGKAGTKKGKQEKDV